MLLITYRKANGRCLAFLVGERIYDCHQIHPALPETGEEFVANWERLKPIAQLMNTALQTNGLKRDLEHIEIGTAEDVQALVWQGM